MSVLTGWVVSSYLDVAVTLNNEHNELVEAHLLWVSVEVEIDHDLPGDVAADGSTQTQHLPGQHPPHQTDGVDALEKGEKE